MLKPPRRLTAEEIGAAGKRTEARTADARIAVRLRPITIVAVASL